ncbi:coiled-coil domain-containing protein 8 [Suncus etruscus]|uniref:coiled-coil domain-containing protein 8 n=1 Tax=Suncus etruscus TaxID=109475 RepID=UPI0021104492|nr:coiled-coil domain-containing protein 8 [Suncus etruscus]
MRPLAQQQISCMNEALGVHPFSPPSQRQNQASSANSAYFSREHNIPLEDSIVLSCRPGLRKYHREAAKEKRKPSARFANSPTTVVFPSLHREEERALPGAAESGGGGSAAFARPPTLAPGNLTILAGAWRTDLIPASPPCKLHLLLLGGWTLKFREVIPRATSASRFPRLKCFVELGGVHPESLNLVHSCCCCCFWGLKFGECTPRFARLKCFVELGGTPQIPPTPWAPAAAAAVAAGWTLKFGERILSPSPSPGRPQPLGFPDLSASWSWGVRAPPATVDLKLEILKTLEKSHVGGWFPWGFLPSPDFLILWSIPDACKDVDLDVLVEALRPVGTFTKITKVFREEDSTVGLLQIGEDVDPLRIPREVRLAGGVWRVISKPATKEAEFRERLAQFLEEEGRTLEDLARILERSTPHPPRPAPAKRRVRRRVAQMVTPPPRLVVGTYDSSNASDSDLDDFEAVRPVGVGKAQAHPRRRRAMPVSYLGSKFLGSEVESGDDEELVEAFLRRGDRPEDSGTALHRRLASPVPAVDDSPGPPRSKPDSWRGYVGQVSWGKLKRRVKGWAPRVRASGLGVFNVGNEAAMAGASGVAWGQASPPWQLWRPKISWVSFRRPRIRKELASIWADQPEGFPASQRAEAADNPRAEAPAVQEAEAADNQRPEAMADQWAEPRDNQRVEVLAGQEAEADHQRAEAPTIQDAEARNHQRAEAADDQRAEALAGQEAEAANNQRMEAPADEGAEARDNQRAEGNAVQEAVAPASQRPEVPAGPRAEAILPQRVNSPLVPRAEPPLAEGAGPSREEPEASRGARKQVKTVRFQTPGRFSWFRKARRTFWTGPRLPVLPKRAQRGEAEVGEREEQV